MKVDKYECGFCHQVFSGELEMDIHQCQPSHDSVPTLVQKDSVSKLVQDPSPEKEPSVKQCPCKMIHCEVCGNQVSATEGLLDKISTLQSQLLKAEAALKASEERAATLQNSLDSSLAQLKYVGEQLERLNREEGFFTSSFADKYEWLSAECFTILTTIRTKKEKQE